MLFFQKNGNNKATVAVTVTEDDTKPTDAPSTAPSDTPSDTPTDTPTDAPTDAPSTAPTTLGKITELKATKATQLTATFDSAVPADTTIAVTKGSSEIKGTSKIDGSTVVFDTEANLTTGTYTLTATLGEAKVSADVDVKDSHVAKIVITSKEALTGEVETTTGSAIKEAYIYYDVLNQYDESIRNSTSIDWTTSVGNEGKKVNKALGKITVRAEQAALNYGSLIYITGVHTSTGTVVNTSIPVGMAQAVNTIEFSGFINKDDPTKLVDSLPVNFPNGKYLLAYRTFDQNGNEYEVSGQEVTKGQLSFISDNVLLIDPSSFKDKGSGDADYAGIYTVNGTEYSTVTINPGEYAGKGGEVNITAIANKTGQKTVKNFVVGSAGLLQSLSLDTPADVVADGDQWVKLPYTAKDVDGKNITNYETIIRSSNALNLTASDGTLYIMEENDGTAGIYWCDESKNATDFASISVDGVDRSVSLGTLVIGGDSNMMILPVSDARRPVAIKSVKLIDTKGNGLEDAFAEGGEATIRLINDNSGGQVVYLDQYGKELKEGDNRSILAAYFSKVVKNKKYAIKVKPDGNGNNLKVKEADGSFTAIPADGKAFQYSGTGKFEITLKADMDVQSKVDAINAGSGTAADKAKAIDGITGLSTTFKFSVVEADSAKADSNINNWDNVDKEKNIIYTVVPVHQLSGYSISKLGKQEIVTNNSANANFAASGSAIAGPAVGDLTVVSKKINPGTEVVSNEFTVTGKTKDGKTVVIPSQYYTASGGAFETSGNTLSKVADNVLKWSDLYDENTARLTRRDVVKELKLLITAPGLKAEGEPVSQKVTISDAEGVPTDVRFFKDWYQYDPTDVTFLSGNTEISSNSSAIYRPWDATLNIGRYTNFQVHVFDQYGKVYEGIGKESWGDNTPGVDVGEFIEYTVSDIKESTSEFTHLANSFKVEQNGSTYNKLKITGAELGDTYTLTATIPETNISKSVKVTVGADTSAYVSKGKVNSDSDEMFRKDKLNYKK